MEPGQAGRPPWMPRWWLFVAGRMAPSLRRLEWLAAWRARMQAWWMLRERGEMPGDADEQGSLLCRGALNEALWLRLSREYWRSVLRGPWTVCAASVAAFAALFAVSRGLAATFALKAIWISHAATRRTGRYDAPGDKLVANLAPIVVAYIIAVVMAGREGIPTERQNRKYWLFLGWKALAAAVLLPLAWIEGGAIIRSHLPYEVLRIFLGGLGCALAFVGATGYAMHWVLLDQRQRCPVCLQRLTLPVRLGSWASVFDPATTEMVCEAGHGTLTVAELEHSEPDKWTELDESWRTLFEPLPAGGGETRGTS